MKIKTNNKRINKSHDNEKNKSFEIKKTNNLSILREIEDLKTNNQSLKTKNHKLMQKEKYINTILYYNSLENLGDSYTKEEIINYKKSHEYLSKEFFDIVSKLKCELRKNKFDFSRLIEENKILAPVKIKIIEEKYKQYSIIQKTQIEDLQKENFDLNKKLDDLCNILKKDKN